MEQVYPMLTRIRTRSSMNLKRIHCGTGRPKTRKRLTKTGKSADKDQKGSKKKRKKKAVTALVLKERNKLTKSGKSAGIERRVSHSGGSEEDLEQEVSGSDSVPKIKPRKRKATVDDGVQVYQMKCGRECFPLLDYHCSLLSDIATKYQKLKPLLFGKKHDVAIPNIARSKDLLFTVVTNGKISEDLPLIVRKQNMGSITFTDITEKSHVSNTIHEAKGSSCCLVLEHSDVHLDVKAEAILRVSSLTSKTAPRQKDDREIESDMTEQNIRKRLTYLLGDPLFSYAGNIAERLKKLTDAKSTADDPDELVEQATQAAHALLNRKDTSRPSRSLETDRIPDKVSMELNKLATDGVLAFGFFPKRSGGIS
ncbi:uncharacterized protein LOC110443912 isoform X2 [Mizuhopecten yessoensis]|uniref:uncharacterized protein LOC110443912 isoform X2 n=1 Tax=Mizuhopecten yessoensis TaxID=6573 RepID=UPI000B45ED78|nr:uncharacterized protein LOC110443912 isoform X2 [Mizuhopecten yessoensis]